MVKTREIQAEKQRIRRATAKAVAKQGKEIRRRHLREMLHLMRTITSDKNFAQLISDRGATSIPRRLASNAEAVLDPLADVSNDEYGNAALDFVVAWRFFFPLLQIQEIVDYLEKNWPNFTANIKDVFIAIVMFGPIPDERRIALKETYFR